MPGKGGEMKITKFEELITNNTEVRKLFSELREIQEGTHPKVKENEGYSDTFYMQSKGGRTTSFIKKIKRDCALIILSDLKINNPDYFNNFTALSYQLFCKKLFGFSVAKKDILKLVNKEKEGLGVGKKVAGFVNEFYEEHFKNCDYQDKLHSFVFSKSRRTDIDTHTSISIILL